MSYMRSIFQFQISLTFGGLIKKLPAVHKSWNLEFVHIYGDILTSETLPQPPLR